MQLSRTRTRTGRSTSGGDSSSNICGLGTVDSFTPTRPTRSRGLTTEAGRTPDRFNAGEAYQIKRVLSALDQNGRGKGDLIVTTNGMPQNPRWTHQALEPCMSWNNIVTANGHAIGFGRWFEDTEVAGRDYYNLGGGFPRDVIPAQVQAIYTSALNGGFIYDHEFPYPHPLVTDPP